MIEKEKDFVCSKNHNQPIQQVIINHQIQASHRLLCASCISELEGQFVSISFQQAKNLIQQKQEKLKETLSQSTKQTQTQLSLFKQEVNTLKFNIIQQFDSLIKNSEEWSINLAEFQKSKSQYSLLDEIEHINETLKYQEEKIIFELNQFNYSYYKKFETMFEIDNIFQNIVQTKEAIDVLNNESTVQSYSMPQQRIEIRQYDENSTPYIAENCKNHQKEIIQVDIRKGIKKEDRLKCINCEKDSSVTVVKFGKLWDEFYKNRQQRINNKQSEQKKKLDDLKENLGHLLRETILFLDQKRFLSETNIDTSQLINIAEILSQDEQITKGKVDEENQKIFDEGFNKFDKFAQYLNQAFETFKFQRIAYKKNQEKQILNGQTTSESLKSVDSREGEIRNSSIKIQN